MPECSEVHEEYAEGLADVQDCQSPPSLPHGETVASELESTTDPGSAKPPGVPPLLESKPSTLLVGVESVQELHGPFEPVNSGTAPDVAVNEA